MPEESPASANPADGRSAPLRAPGAPSDDVRRTVPLAVIPILVAAPPVVIDSGEEVPFELPPEPTLRRWWQKIRRRDVWAWSSSCLFHGTLLVLLGLIVQASRHAVMGTDLIATIADPEQVRASWDEEPLPAQTRLSPSEGAAISREHVHEKPHIDLPRQDTAGPGNTAVAAVGTAKGQLSELMLRPGGLEGSLEGRGPQARARWVREGGGNGASEEAVERGLRWLVAHQNRDGSWHFNHQDGPCAGLCRHTGTETSTTAATALALLPFLGAGYTHLQGEHQMTVRKGLYYLASRAVLTANGADLQEGSMYGQGLAAIALCEAYAMTHDPGLKDLAQRSIDFIVFAQDHNGGGWRYAPGQPGDTTVTGWQLMALKSAQMAGLKSPSPTLFSAGEFLDSVQSDEGAKYGYMSPDPRPATTAVGLLCRMYSGWKHDRPALLRGVAYLSELGPSQSDDAVYFNYYASQVLRHFGGSQWDRWNAAMRDPLVAAQATEGHEAGSWYFPGRHSQAGGRLYTTAVTILTLEVYYRYLPLYREETTR